MSRTTEATAWGPGASGRQTHVRLSSDSMTAKLALVQGDGTPLSRATPVYRLLRVAGKSRGREQHPSAYQRSPQPLAGPSAASVRPAP